MIIQGIAYFAKVLGKPQPAFDKTKTEWTIDLSVDDKVKAQLKKEGLDHKVRNKNDERGDFISFKRPGTRSDGTASTPIRVVGPDGKTKWDDNTLIGNGSAVRVSFVINEGTYNGKPYKKPGIIAIQVMKLVPYERDDGFEAVETDGEEDWAA